MLQLDPLDAGAAARAHGEIAILALASIAADPKAPATARVAAACKLLERGFGRVLADGGLVDDLSGISDDELDLMLQPSQA